MAPYQHTNEQDDVDNGVEEAINDYIENENDVPVLEEDYNCEEGDDVEEEEQADTVEKVDDLEDKYDATIEEGREWLCGWIALKFKSVYPHLQVPKDQMSTVSEEHQYSEKPPHSFVEYVSYGGLVVPSKEFLTISEILDAIFEKMNGNDFIRVPGILADLCKKAETVLTAAQKSITPPDVVKRYFKLRICIRVKYKNQNLKETKLRNKLKQLEKLRKVAT